MQVLKRVIALATGCGALIAGGSMALAGLGQPSPWEIGLQQSASPVMDQITSFHNFLLYIIIGITIFVLGLLLIVIVRFNSKANPVPSKTTHNTTLEVLWTVIPVLILVVIAVPSFRLLFTQLTIPPADVTVKATGKQWYWSYNYPDNGDFEFDSLMLTVDNFMVVPVNKVVRLLTTGADVIHSFSIPSFGVKIDAIPGRVNEAWFKATKEGIYYGQCSQLCGRDHAFMPIEVHVVSDRDFAAWIDQAKKKFARGSGEGSTDVAAADGLPAE
jgi:cytochrome c oxidase subunit 2